jgi:hypothetical protein
LQWAAAANLSATPIVEVLAELVAAMLKGLMLLLLDAQ